jgi:hypothetical protein
MENLEIYVKYLYSLVFTDKDNDILNIINHFNEKFFFFFKKIIFVIISITIFIIPGCHYRLSLLCF